MIYDAEILKDALDRMAVLQREKPAMGYWELSDLCRKVADQVDAKAFLRDNIDNPELTDMMEIGTDFEPDSESQIVEVTLTDVVRGLVRDWLTSGLRAQWDRDARDAGPDDRKSAHARGDVGRTYAR